MAKQEVIQSIFQNIEALGRIMAGRQRQPYSKDLPTHAQTGVLLVISHNEPQNIKDLARKFGMTSSAATQLVNGLVQEGLLIRKEDKIDRRNTRLVLTAKGRKNIIDIKKQRYEMMSEILETLNSQELLQLKQIQEKITERVKLLWTRN